VPKSTSDEQRFRALVQFGLHHRSAGNVGSLPILSIWGTRGSDLSALLNRTAGEWATRVPLAHFHGNQFAGPGVVPVLLTLTELLGQDVRRFGQLLFPRFVLGFVATRGPLDEDLGPARREEMIRRALAGSFKNTKKWVKNTAAALVGVVGAPAVLAPFVGMVAGDAFAAVMRARVLRGAALSWYKTGVGGVPKNSGIDGLVELARFVDDDEWVEAVLCRAFLEDLRAGYAFTLSRLFARDRNCLIVIDQAGAEGPRKFLDVVSADRQPDHWDPLLVVAASTLRHPTADVSIASAWRSRSLSEASFSFHDWQEHRHDYPGWRSRYPLHWRASLQVSALEGPASAAVRRPFASLLPPVLDQATRRAVTAVRRLTAEHPAGLTHVLHALGLPHHDPAEPADFRSVLASVDDAGEAVDDRIVALLLGDQWVDIPRSVVRMALLRDLGPVQLAQVIEHTNGEDPARIWDFVARDVWVEPPYAGAPETAPIMHPLVRRAVAHRLARYPLHNLVWMGEHQWLRNSAPDETTALYHDLAAGNVATVAQNIGAQLQLERVDAWFEQLLAVTQAPVSDIGWGADAAAHHAHLVKCAGEVPGHVSTALVAALQLHTDPLGDPTHQLCEIVAHELQALAPHAGEGAVFLFMRATAFHDCWLRWNQGVE